MNNIIIDNNINTTLGGTYLRVIMHIVSLLVNWLSH